MDIVYAVSPFWNDVKLVGRPSQTPSTAPYKPENRAKSGMPDPDKLLDLYARISGWDPRRESGGKDWEIAKIFHYVRSGTITHGIQARTITGQASSDFSRLYFENTRKSLDTALKMVEALREEEAKARL